MSAVSRVSFDHSESLRLPGGKCWHCVVSPSAQCPVRSLVCSYIGCLAEVNLWDAAIYTSSLTSAVNVLYPVHGEKIEGYDEKWGTSLKQKWNPVNMVRHWCNRSPFALGSAPAESVFWQDDESKGEEPDGYTVCPFNMKDCLLLPKKTVPEHTWISSCSQRMPQGLFRQSGPLRLKMVQHAQFRLFTHLLRSDWMVFFNIFFDV